MSARYVTLKKSAPEFSDLLWGRFEKNERAIPVKTYNAGTEDEMVTFEMLDKKNLHRPGPAKFIAALVKLHRFILILLPLYYVIGKSYREQTLNDPVAVTLAAFSVIFLFAGLNIRNDIHDHISGFDRVNTDVPEKVIRNGWMTALQASKVSLILVALSAMTAAPVCLLHPEILWVVLIAAVLFFVGRFARQNSYKQQHFGELVLFVLTGPALVAGYQLAAGAPLDQEVLMFGTLWGVAVFYLVQLNNFSHIMTSSQAGIRNTMTKLGFDRSQKFLIGTWSFFLALWAGFHYLYAEQFWQWIPLVVLIADAIPLFRRILNIKSPMGSGLQQVKRKANTAFLGAALLLTMEQLWYVWGPVF